MSLYVCICVWMFSGLSGCAWEVVFWSLNFSVAVPSAWNTSPHSPMAHSLPSVCENIFTFLPLCSHYPVSYFPVAAITNYSKLGGLKQQKFTLTVPEARSLQSRRWQPRAL